MFGLFNTNQHKKYYSAIELETSRLIDLLAFKSLSGDTSFFFNAMLIALSEIDVPFRHLLHDPDYYSAQSRYEFSKILRAESERHKQVASEQKKMNSLLYGHYSFKHVAFMILSAMAVAPDISDQKESISKIWSYFDYNESKFELNKSIYICLFNKEATLDAYLKIQDEFEDLRGITFSNYRAVIPVYASTSQNCQAG